MLRYEGVSLRRALRLSAGVVLMVTLAGTALPFASASSSTPRYRPTSASGDLQAYVNAFVAKNPGRNSGTYDVPSFGERAAMADAWRALVAGDLQAAANIAGPLGYSVVRYTDSATGRVARILVERNTAGGTWVHGWGLYAWSAAPGSPLLVEVAHPIADVDTEDIGVVAFRRAGARALFVAGAHRDANADGSADVAHRADTVFDAVHDASLASGLRVLQPHGFADSTLPNEAVVSRGDAPTPVTRGVEAALDSALFDACLYDGSTCSELGATTNVQGGSARAGGAEFVHVEVARRVRADATRRDHLATVVADSLR